MSIPVILDTDIGTDIDDAWALIQMLNSPELDVKLICTCTHDTRYRAAIVAEFLEICGRTDIPIAIGRKTIPKSESGADTNTHQESLGDYSLDDYPGIVLENAAEAIVECVQSSEQIIKIVAIGPNTNISDALELDPQIINQATYIGMQGSVYRGYGDSEQISSEYNIREDIPAAQNVFSAAWEKLITPLDTCGIVSLSGERYQACQHSKNPAIQKVMAHYAAWAKWHKREDAAEHRSSTLFDTVAVQLAISEDYMHFEDVKISVDDEGFTQIDEHGQSVRIARRWTDQEAFLDDLLGRLRV